MRSAKMPAAKTWAGNGGLHNVTIPAPQNERLGTTRGADVDISRGRFNPRVENKWQNETLDKKWKPQRQALLPYFSSLPLRVRHHVVLNVDIPN